MTDEEEEALKLEIKEIVRQLREKTDLLCAWHMSPYMMGREQAEANRRSYFERACRGEVL